MSTVPFLPKDDQALPDNYGMKILYVNGKTDDLELASHVTKDKIIFTKLAEIDVEKDGKKEKKIVEQFDRAEVAPVPFLEYVTKDDLWGWVPISSIQRLEFDKRFSKIIAIKNKQENEKENN
jgi:hypothetical protein